MIPRLPGTAPPPRLILDFLDELRSLGFAGDISATDADRVTFATDNSIYQLPPQAVVSPRDSEDVTWVMKLLARPHFQTVVIAARGGGTGTNAQSLTSGVVVDLSRHMNHILEIDVAGRWVRVQAGVVKDSSTPRLHRMGCSSRRSCRPPTARRSAE